ncbi:MAG: aminomethyl-transferring glycine dehydrogenase subunit GcvPA [Candidatus Geothermarchaeales archaeon]
MRAYIPNDDHEIVANMLREIGVDSLDDLFLDVPRDIRIEGSLNLPRPVPEDEVKRLVEAKLCKNLDVKHFLGGGVWSHNQPAVVSHLLSRGEFLTSYTPYQPEISQGTIQVLFEYQTMVCQITGMDVANSSVYDWGSAAAEAVLMASRVTHRGKALLAPNVGPHRRRVIETYAKGAGIDVTPVQADWEAGTLDLEKLKEAIDDKTSSLYVEIPSYIGSIEPRPRDIAEVLHDKNALLIVGVDPFSLGILNPPGEYSADIVVGEGQPLGSSPYFGGPLLGIFATTRQREILRQMPGRIMGMTKTLNRRQRAFAMILQVREQHIRREWATSNICTNEALTATAAAVYLSLLGEEGFRGLSEDLSHRAAYLSNRLRKDVGLSAPPYSSSFYRDFLVSFKGAGKAGRIIREGIERGVLIGTETTHPFPHYGESLLAGVSDDHTKEDLDKYVEIVQDLLGGAP